MTALLPAEFADLEPYAADWALPTERLRYEKRLSCSMDELQAFYDTLFPRLDDASAYLEKFAVDQLDDAGKRLFWLFASLVTVSFPVEVWRQPTVPESGASTFDVYVEPRP